MPQSLSGICIHLIFSTKDRLPLISDDMKIRLHEYIGAILSSQKCRPILQGGITDHVHCLFWLHPTIALSELVRRIKANSSLWIHETFPDKGDFRWQAGYGAFSVSASNIRKVKEYIVKQDEHHRRRSFKDEFLALLKKYEVTYNETYIWD